MQLKPSINSSFQHRVATTASSHSHSPSRPRWSSVNISVNLDTPEYISIIFFYWRFHLPCFPCHRYVVLKFRLLLTTTVFLNFTNLIFRCISILTLLKDLRNRSTWDFPLNPHKTTEQDEIKSTWHGFLPLHCHTLSIHFSVQTSAGSHPGLNFFRHIFQWVVQNARLCLLQICHLRSKMIKMMTNDHQRQQDENALWKILKKNTDNVVR